MLRYGLQQDDGDVTPLRLGVFAPAAGDIARIEVRTGAELTTLDSLGDYEALIQRAQDDRKFSTIVDITLALFRDAALSDISLAARSFGFSIDSVPDLRSWNALPRRVHVARVPLPANANAITLVSRSESGSVLAEMTAPLSDQRQSFLYARAHGRGLWAEPPARLWIDGKLEEA